MLQARDVPALVGGPVAPSTQMYNTSVLGLRSPDAPLLAPQPGRPLAEWQARAAPLDVPALAEGKARFRAPPG